MELPRLVPVGKAACVVYTRQQRDLRRPKAHTSQSRATSYDPSISFSLESELDGRSARYDAMSGKYFDSPATERDDQSRIDKTNFDVDFSIMPSFASPAKRDDDLLNQIKGMGNPKGARILSTPRIRQPLGERSNPPAKVEFTPLLKSATANRLKQVGNDGKVRGLATPAALRPGFKLDVTPLPEHSTIDSSSVVDEGTPVVAVASSSLDLSTPLALPKRGEGGLGDGGNVLTLREQEAVCCTNLSQEKQH